MNDLSGIPRRTYLFVYLGLMVLLAGTVAAAYLPLGSFHLVITVGIAIAKAALVILFFMHLRHMRERTIFLVSGGLLLLLILIGLTTVDYLTRANGLSIVP
jgi:cytochrome c oxidase subunit 4